MTDTPKYELTPAIDDPMCRQTALDAAKRGLVVTLTADGGFKYTAPETSAIKDRMRAIDAIMVDISRVRTNVALMLTHSQLAEEPLPDDAQWKEWRGHTLEELDEAENLIRSGVLPNKLCVLRFIHQARKALATRPTGPIGKALAELRGDS